MKTKLREAKIVYKITGEIDLSNKLDGPNAAYTYLYPILEEDPYRERLIVVAINTQNIPLAYYVSSTGTLNWTVFSPREIFRWLLLQGGASQFLIGHNHPSGIATPSEDDKISTRRLSFLGKELGITLLDHIIVGNGTCSFVSLKDLGVF